jgi:hypothetical protein
MKCQTACSVGLGLCLFLWATSLVMAQPSDTLSVKRSLVLRNEPSEMAIAIPNGFLLVGGSDKTSLMSRVDSTGVRQWSQTVANLRAVSVAKDQLALVQQLGNGQLSLSVLNVNKPGKVLWRTEVGPGSEADAAIQTDQRVIVVTRTPGGLTLYNLTASGQSGWGEPVILPDPEPGGQLDLFALPNNGLVLTVGSTVIGLTHEGHKRWAFDFGRDKIQWNQKRLLRNGQLALVGQGVAIAFGPNNLDARIMVIDPQTGHQVWTKVLTMSDTREAGIDVLENPDQTLMVLLQEPTGASLLHLNARHEIRVVGRLIHPAQEVTNYVAIVSRSGGRYGIVSATANQTRWQEMGQWQAPLTPRPKANMGRVNLYGLSVGVTHPPIRFAASDATALADAFEREQGRGFANVEFEVLNTPDRNRTDQIAAVTERWANSLKPQPDDWVVVFVSGMLLDHHNDLRLVGSDYDPATPRSTTLSLRALLTDLNALPCRKLILLDASLTPTPRPGQYSPRPGANRAFDFSARQFPNTWILAGGQPDQAVYEDAAWQHGAFTRALLDALSGKADTDTDGQLRLDELNAYLSENVPVLVRKQLQKEQQPTWLLRSGDAVLMK